MMHIFLDRSRELRIIYIIALMHKVLSETEGAPQRDVVKIDPLLLFAEKSAVLLVRKHAGARRTASHGVR